MKHRATPAYIAVHRPDADLAFGLCDVSTLDAIDPNVIRSIHALLSSCSLLVLDANLSKETIRAAVDEAHRASTPIIFECVSVVKSRKIVDAGCLSNVKYLTGNEFEIDEIFRRLKEAEKLDDSKEPTGAQLVRCGVEFVIESRGSKGVCIFRRDDSGAIISDFLSSIPVKLIANTNGAGFW